MKNISLYHHSLYSLTSTKNIRNLEIWSLDLPKDSKNNNLNKILD